MAGTSTHNCIESGDAADTDPAAPTENAGRGSSTTTRSRRRRQMQRTPIRDLFIGGLQHSPLLRRNLPKVRRLALIETLRSLVQPQQHQHVPIVSGASTSTSILEQTMTSRTNNTSSETSTDAKALEIILYNVETSPYLTREQFQHIALEVLQHSALSPTAGANNTTFTAPLLSSSLRIDAVNAMAEKILDDDWGGLLELVSELEDGDLYDEDDDQQDVGADARGTHDRPRHTKRWSWKRMSYKSSSTHRDNSARIRSFRDMLVEIMSSSRKVAAMDIGQRRVLGRKIHAASTIQDMRAVLTGGSLRGIFTTRREREEIRDILRTGRYDLILLPQCLDCDEKPRRRRLPTEEEGDDDGEEMVEECVICLGELDHLAGVTTLSCQHSFCTECIREWMATSSNTCPVCRAQIGHQNVNVQVAHHADHGHNRGGEHHPNVHHAHDSVSDFIFYLYVGVAIWFMLRTL